MLKFYLTRSELYSFYIGELVLFHESEADTLFRVCIEIEKIKIKKLNSVDYRIQLLKP